jgi:hypothetical protein
MISCLFYKSEVGFVGGLNLRIKIDINRNQILLYVTILIYAWTGPELFQPGTTGPSIQNLSTIKIADQADKMLSCLRGGKRKGSVKSACRSALPTSVSDRIADLGKMKPTV